MKDGTGLTEFQKQYPNRFFDVGIAEQHAIGFAAGMAKAGMIPVVPIYSSFYQRAYDQVIHDVALQELPVVMCADRAGIVGADGETHQGLLDMSFFRLVPNLTILAPKDFKELEMMLEFAVNLEKPVVIRYPRGGEDEYKFNSEKAIELGKAEILKEGKEVTIISIGKMTSRAIRVADRLEKKDINATVINSRFLKPFDKEKISEYLINSEVIVTIEDGTIINGLATVVDEVVVEKNLEGKKILNYAYPDKFIQHGSVSELENIYGLDEDKIYSDILKKLKEKE